MTQPPDDHPYDEPRPRQKVDPEVIRKALEEQAKRRPPRPPVFDTRPPIVPLKVPKPPGRKRRKPGM